MPPALLDVDVRIGTEERTLGLTDLIFLNHICNTKTIGFDHAFYMKDIVYSPKFILEKTGFSGA